MTGPAGAADPADTSRALARCASLGPYFTVEDAAEDAVEDAAGFAVDVADEGGWRPFSNLVEDRKQLRAAVEVTRVQLDSESRVAASLWLLGWSARVLSPLLGSLATSNVLPLLTPAGLLWRPAVPGPVQLAARSPTGVRLALDDSAAVALAALELYAVGVDGLLAPLVMATRSLYGVPEQVLWGNVASALAGSAGVIARALPDRAAIAGALAVAMLEVGELSERGRFRPGGSFVRKSCCFAYRIPPGALCGDCVLATPRRGLARS